MILWKLNPSFPYGGIICPKTTIFNLFQANKAPFDAFFCTSLSVRLEHSFHQRVAEAQTFIKKHALHYPLILKPDDSVGGMGLHFIKDEMDLHKFLALIHKDYVLQEYLPCSLELSVFFIKYPGQKGKIWSITRRYTVKDHAEPELMIPTRKIICKDESYLISPILEQKFNDISNIHGFYFGRFDIRVEDLHAFSKGEGFKIIEVNVGVHSMALHAFDTKYSWIQRYKIFFDQLRFAFEISRKNKDLSSSYPHQNLKSFFCDLWIFFKV